MGSRVFYVLKEAFGDYIHLQGTTDDGGALDLRGRCVFIRKL